MKSWIFGAVVLGALCSLPLSGVWLGYRLAQRSAPPRPWESNQHVADQVHQWDESQTLAGAFRLANHSLDGLEKCYYAPAVDFSRITWVGRDAPAPFVGYAPAAGPQASGHINSQRFRYPRDLVVPKPPGVCRIFLVGGSTAFGAGARSNETTVAGYLETLLNASGGSSQATFEVVTAAACAWASTHERIVIENRLVEFEPDVVVSLSGHNDAFWGAQGRNIEWFRGFQDEYFFTLAMSMLSINFGQQFPAEAAAGPPVDPALSTSRLMRNVRLAAQSLQEVGCEYCYALQPILACTQKQRSPREARTPSLIADEGELQRRYAAFRAGFAREQAPNLHFVDLTPVFDDLDPSTDVFIDGCHFGDRGNERIAQALSNWLRVILDQRRHSPVAAVDATRR